MLADASGESFPDRSAVDPGGERLGDRVVDLAPDPETQRHEAVTDAWRLYVAEAKPREVVTAIYDDSEPNHPRRVFADSC